MKKVTKRLIACILSALLLITSIPFTALANEDDYNALVGAINEYETKMNGTVYANMKNAYDKYITAKETKYAYNYGGNTSVNCRAAADNLAAATAAMTAWTGVSVDSQQFNYGGVVPSEFSKNVIYATTPGSFGNYDVIIKAAGITYSSTMYRFLLPKNAVLLYSGRENDEAVLPIMCAYHNAIGAGGNDNAPLGLYVNDNSVNETKEDSSDLTLTGIWKGYRETVVSGGPDNANAFSWSDAYGNGNDTLPGYNKATTEATGKDNRGEKQTTNNGDKWWQYANTMKYTHTDDSFVNGFRSFEFSFTGRTLRFTNVFGGTEADWHLYSKYASGNASWYGTYYVIDYSGVDAALTSAASKLLNFNGKKYIHGELNDILNAFEVLESDPSAQGYTDNNIAAKAQNVASTIQNTISYLNNATAPAVQDRGYNALAANISAAKATYTDNNSQGIYTDESFAAFKTAYEASQAEAAAVAEDGFTTATTAAALDTAYKGLNRKADESGTSGDTDYTYNSETGTVTVSGIGDMADYESGSESPLGGNPNITNVVIDPNVNYIGAHAFENDNNLTTITVPAAATYGEGAFDGCTKLATVIIVGGAVDDASAANAPWKQPSVKVVKLGENDKDFSVTSIGDNVFADSRNTAFYIYNNLCDFSDVSNNTFGTNPTIYGFVPSTAYDYAEKFHYSFVSLGHEHIWDEGVVTEPTCMAGGYTTYKCKFCDAEKKGNYTSALDHSWDEGQVIDPTCTERGYTLKTCTRPGCGETTKEHYKKSLGHDFTGAVSHEYGDGQIYSTAMPYKHATACTRCEASKEEYCSFKVKDERDPATGFLVFECQTCHGTYLYNDSTGSGEHMVFYFGENNEMTTERVADGTFPTQVPQVQNPEVGHVYKWTQDGVEVNPAEVRIYSDTIFKLENTLVQYTVSYYDTNGLIKTEKVNHGATPTDIPELPADVENHNDAGHKVYVWDKDPYTAVITADTSFTQEFLLKEHDFLDTIIQEATCAEDGIRSRYCTTCHYNITNEVIEATGNHDFVENTIAKATCTTDGKIEKTCSVCQKKETETVKAAGHKWNAGVITLQPTVEDYGIKTYTCTVCKATKTEKLNKISVKEATPTDAQANKAKVNKSIKKPAGITTVSNAKKKQLIISFNKVKGAQNYRVMYRKQGAKKWTYAWTNGKTTYTLKKLKNRGLYEFMFAAYTKNAKGVWERGEYSKTSYRYYYKAAINKVTPAKKAAKVSWGKDKYATGYQLYYATNKNMKGAKCVNLKKNQTSYTIKKLNKKKKYYVRVRALRKVKGKTYVGEYSQRKAFKVK